MIYVRMVSVDDNKSVSDQLKGYLRGQWVYIRGMRARIVNHIGNQVVLWMNNDKMIAVFR